MAKQFFPALPLALLATLPVVQLPAAAALAAEAPAQRDGQHDFDWEFGSWNTSVRVLRNPLTGEAPDWVTFEGTSVVKPLLGGRANFVELSVKNASGSIEGGALRLYKPRTGHWNVNYASLSNGVLTAPVFGSFDGNGRGEFVGQDQLDGRTILVRFVMTRVSPTEARFEQFYSVDGGKAWELNWLAIDQRP
ncbi:MAG: hypothetical protein LOX97_08565 [Sphingomonas sp.]|nr:hypothetical protein [Sphingomonas sp.]